PVAPALRRLPDDAGAGLWLGLVPRPVGPAPVPHGSLADAAAAAGEADRRLGESLARLAEERLPPDAPLVLDTDALRALGLTADTPLAARTGAAFWEPLGLAAVPAAGAHLLTSRRQAADWQAGGPPVPGSIAAAVAAAAAAGHDASGRFRTV